MVLGTYHLGVLRPLLQPESRERRIVPADRDQLVTPSASRLAKQASRYSGFWVGLARAVPRQDPPLKWIRLISLNSQPA